MIRPVVGQYVKVSAVESQYYERKGYVTSKDRNSTGDWWYVHFEGEKRPLAFPAKDLDDAGLPEKIFEPLVESLSISPYHTVHIPKGVYGEHTKILEEVLEFQDALKQDNPILVLCELADLVGAIGGYVEKHHNITLEDIIKMTKLNRKAFEDGHRT